MNILGAILGANDGQAVTALSRQFGLSPDQTSSAIGALLPALAGGLQRNVSQQGGLEALVGALSAQPGAGVELARILERFESSPGQSGKFYARELRTALAVFGKDRAPAAAG